MPPLEWDKVMAAKAAKLSDDEVEEFYESLAEFEAEDVTEIGKLQKLFDVTRAVMKSKHEASEELIEEFEKETKSNEKKAESQNAEVEKLKKKVAELEKYGPSEGGPTTARGTGVLRDQVTELEQQNDQLRQDVKDLQRDLSNEKRAAEKYSERISELETTMKELRDENDQSRQDISDYKMQLQSQRENLVSRRGDDIEFAEKLRKKNHDLAEAMEELQNLTDANEAYQQKIEDLQKNLQDAIMEMDRTREDYMKLKNVLQQSDAVTDKLREENEILKAQVTDLNEQVQSKTDADDAIMVAVNNKVEEWKVILQQKDAIILEQQEQNINLRDELIAATMDADKASVAALSKVVKEKDRQIEELTDQIKNYVDEMESNAAVIDDLRTELQRTGAGSGDRQQVRIRELQNEVNHQKNRNEDMGKELRIVEADAREKDKDLTDALERMRKYETGEYGLADAVAEIKECKTQMKIRDRQIEELTQYINKVEMKINDMDEENEDLRYRLGLDPKEPLDLTDFRKNKNIRKEEEKALNFILQREVEKLEDERADLKKKIRKLAQQTGQRAVALGLTAEDMMAVQDYQEEIKAKRKKGEVESSTANQIKKEVAKEEHVLRFREADDNFRDNMREMDKLYRENTELKVKVEQLEENTNQLEQGLKEVLENMKKYSPDEKGAEELGLRFPTLERMLAAIEAKSVIGKYDTSLYLKAQVDNLQGRNDELRSELREMRHESNKSKLELAKSIEKIEQLEADLKAAKDAGGGTGIFQKMPLPVSMAVTSSEVISSLNEHLVVVLQELSLKEEAMQKMEESLDNYRRKFGVMRHQQGLLYSEYIREKKEWEEETTKMKEQLQKIEGNRDEDKVRIQEFDRLVDTLSKDDAEVRRRLSEMTRRVTVLRVNEKALTRRHNIMEEMDAQMRKEKNNLKNEMAAQETSVSERIGYLQRFKDMATFRVTALQKALENTVPSEDLELTNKKYHELTEKYRDTLEKGNSLVSKAEAITGLEGEVKRLTEDNEVLKKTLEMEKEKLHSLEAAMEDLHKRGITEGTQIKHVTDTDVITISKKITTLEMKELNERQRAEHAVRMYDQQRSILTDLENRNKELEEKFSEITKSNLELQKIERELRDELAKSVTKEISDADRKRITNLEEHEVSLKNEISKLKEISEVATSQVKTLEMVQLSRDKENTSLRQQLLDFQMQSDEKTIIGKLHRHIVQLQVSEGSAVRKLEEYQKTVTKLQAQILRMEHRLDEKDQTLQHSKTEAQGKAKHLKRNLQELRIQFAGAIPLSRQEKFSKNMMQLQQDKNQLETELKQLREKKETMEDKNAALELQHRTLQDLITTLKDGRGAAKVMEWHDKMDAVRLDELKQRRLNAKLQQQIKYLEGMIRSSDVSLSDMEAEAVQQTKEFEEKQLRWERREVELERTISRLESQVSQIAGAASRFEEAVGTLPDAKLPVANQLEQAISTIKGNVKTILDIKADNKQLLKRNQELEKQLREMDQTVIARDKLVAELRLRMPASAERDEIILKAQTKVTEAMQKKPEKDKVFETEHSIKIAQSTIASLQARIQQKEETIAKYQELLKQAREDMFEMNKRHDTDLKNMQQKIHMNTDAAFNKFKDAARELMSKQTAHPLTTKQAARLNELEDTVAEQDNAMAAMSEKIRQREEEITSLRTKLQMDSKQYNVERERMIDGMKAEIQKKEKEIEELNRQIEHMKKEMDLLNEEIATLKEQNTRAPTTTMKNLVERLKNQLALKEKQHQSLSKALTDLRADMITQAQETVKFQSDGAAQETNVQKLIDKHTKEFVDQVEDLQNQTDRQKKEIRKRKEQEANLQTELEDLKEELARKERSVHRYKGDKQRLEQEVEDLEKKVERMSTMKSQKSGDDGRLQELEEMRRRVRLLEDELKRKQQQPEKPYERPREPAPPPKETPRDKSDELIRWEESKKWQKTVEKMKSKLREKEGELEKSSRTVKMLKDQLDRNIKEKEGLERRMFNLQRAAATPSGPSGPSAPPSKSDHQIEELRTKNFQLQEEVSNLKRQLTMDRDAAYQEIQVKNEYLSQQLEQMERVVAHQTTAVSAAPGEGVPGLGAKEYGELFEKNQSLQRQVLSLSEENIELKFESEQFRKDVPRLKERISDLQKYVEALKIENSQLKGTSTTRSLDSSGSSGIRRIGESGKSTRELEKTVALLKKVVERVQAENEHLKRTPGPAVNQQISSLKLENDGLKTQLDDLRQKMGATLSERYTSTQKGTAKMMTDYEKMRKDLMKEMENNEKLRMEIRNLEVQKEQLNSQLQDSRSLTNVSDRPSMQTTMDSKGWKSAVVTRMYEGKMKDLETEVEKKNKMLTETKTLLKEAAEREQHLLQEREDLKRKVAVLERFPPGTKRTEEGVMRELQQERLRVERLENEKSELTHQMQMMQGMDRMGDEAIAKVAAYDRLMNENVETKMQLKSMETEKSKYRLEVQRLKKELESFGPDFFEEVEDLKYNYKQSVEKNVLYEEKLQQLSKQLGISISIPGIHS